MSWNGGAILTINDSHAPPDYNHFRASFPCPSTNSHNPYFRKPDMR